MTTETIMRIRLPADLKEEIAKAAKDNLRSLNAQVIYMLRVKVADATRSTN